MKDEPADPRRWTTGAPHSPLAQRMGAALRVAAAATLVEARSMRAPAPAPAAARPAPRWALSGMAAVAVLSLAAGTVVAAQAVRLVRRAREAAWSAVNVPAGNTVSISRRAGLRIHARGPLAIQGDDDRIEISGTGEARVETGSRPVEIVTGAGPAVHLAAGATWLPAAPPLSPPRLPAWVSAPAQPREVAAAAPTPPRPAPPDGVSSSRRTVMPSSREPEPPPASAPPTTPPPATWAVTPPAAEIGAGGEATLVAAAFRALRAEHDPVAALSLLERHSRLFPSGVLSVEAGMARVEALLALGRSGQGL